MDTYILVDGVPVPEPDILIWGKWFSADNSRIVARTEADDIIISTVFLGLDRSFSGGTPILFETMIFGGEHADYQERYATLNEAKVGHEAAVALVWGSKAQS